MRTKFSVVNADVVKVQSDLLLLKHAAAFYGVDKYVAQILTNAKLCTIDQLTVLPGKYFLVETRGLIAARRVLFLGTPPLRKFNYAEMQAFARRCIEILSEKAIFPQRIITTVHGAGYGLDAEESLERLVQGFQEGVAAHPDVPVKEVVFGETNERRVPLLASTLEKICPATESDKSPAAPAPSPAKETTKTEQRLKPKALVLPESEAAPVSKPAKKHVFVAMPFAPEFEDVYEYGIYGPVRNCGLICEKTDESAFTGDILQRIRERIETADFVIAEMTGARPNVYLEVGYAWGKGVRVIFLAKEGEKLHFDVSRHRCIFYKNIRQLAMELEKLIRGLLDPASTEKGRIGPGPAAILEHSMRQLAELKKLAQTLGCYQQFQALFEKASLSLAQIDPRASNAMALARAWYYSEYEQLQELVQAERPS